MTCSRRSTDWNASVLSTTNGSRGLSWNSTRAGGCRAGGRSPPRSRRRASIGRAARAALAEIDDPESERARAVELARSRARRMGSLAPEVAYRRLAGLLARRGFAPALCHDAVRRALALESNEDHA